MIKPTYYTSKKLSEIGIDDRVLRKIINYNLNFDEKQNDSIDFNNYNMNYY